jgi:hypothetical protein
VLVDGLGMKIGDSINTPHGKGKLTEIQGKVGIVTVKKMTVYVRLPDDAPDTPLEAPNGN